MNNVLKADLQIIVQMSGSHAQCHVVCFKWCQHPAVFLGKSSSDKVQQQPSSKTVKVQRYKRSPLNYVDEGVCGFMLVFHLIRGLVTEGNIK